MSLKEKLDLKKQALEEEQKAKDQEKLEKANVSTSVY